MPPKKTKAAAGADNDSGKQGFSWTAEKDLQLLYLITIPRSISSKDHEQLAKALGATPGGIRNRAWKIKVDHKKTYEDAGIPMPGGQAASRVAGRDDAASPQGTPTKKRGGAHLGKKRAAPEPEPEPEPEDDGEELGKITKKIKGEVEDALKVGLAIKHEVSEEEN